MRSAINSNVPPSQILQELASSLDAAKQANNGKLPLNSATLSSTAAKNLLVLFSEKFNLTSFLLDTNVVISPVDGNLLTVSGEGTYNDITVSLTLRFVDLQPEIQIESFFQSNKITDLQTVFPNLPADFFNGIRTPETSPNVSIDYGIPLLFFTANVQFGVSGYVIPGNGLTSYYISPQIQGDVNASSQSLSLSIALPYESGGWFLNSITDGQWNFSSLNWLLPNLLIENNFPGIIPADSVSINRFQLYFYGDAPHFNYLYLNVVDKSDPNQPLWSIDDGKIQLTNVLVGIGLENNATTITGRSPSSGFILGGFSLGSASLFAQIPYPLNEGSWVIAAYPNLTLSDGLNDLATLLSEGQSFDELMPADLTKCLQAFELSYLYLAVDPSKFKLLQFTMRISTTSEWKLIPDVLTLKQMQLQMSIQPDGITGGVNGQFKIGESDVYIILQKDTVEGSWFFTVNSPVISLPTLSDISQLANGADLSPYLQASGLNSLHFLIYNLNLGLTLSPTKLTNLGMTLQLANSPSSLDPNLNWEVIPGTLTLTNFSIGFQLNWNPDLQAEVTGFFTLNTLNFALKFGKGANGDAFIAAYSPSQSETGKVNIKNMIASISPSVSSLVPDIDIELKDVFIAYINTNGTKKFVFAMDVEIDFPISNIPLVGKALSETAKVDISDVKVVVASDALTVEEINTINQLIANLPSEMKVEPLAPPAAGTTQEALPKGFSMAAKLNLGGSSILINAPTSANADANSLNSPHPLLLAATNALASPSYYNTMWINIQKTFGPVNIEKIGFSYQDGKLFLLSNLGLAVGGLTIELLGLGIGSSITKPDIAFAIEGLAVSFVEGPVMIAGGMIGSIDPVDFVGELQIKTGTFNLGAFGGYSTINGDNPSMFLYGILNEPPLGGPLPFFIQGLAGGFGFNRDLLIPDVSQIYSFPFVSWATNSQTAPSFDPSKSIGQQVADSLQLLISGGIVNPRIGEYWLAGGVFFTTYQILSSFALVTVSFGAEFEVDLLGLSTLSIPPQSPEVVGEVQLELKVSFSPTKGLFSMAGQLTPNSYLLSRQARLMGGFAFYYWFAGSNAGDFVLSFGGYNPHFSVPSYYPMVPRLGYSLAIESISITGEFYFALTANAVMAGGKLSATWQGGPVRAWFTVWADFLMVFLPFHYYIDGGIDLGASFSVKLLFFRITMTIHIGVDIEIWGPEFAGEATVDLYIISFTIHFGNSDKSKDTTIGWKDFVDKLLPPATTQSSQAFLLKSAGVSDDPTIPPSILHINITQGLIKQLNNDTDNPYYLVDGESFQCEVLTQIPTKGKDSGSDQDVIFSGSVQLAPDSWQPKDTNNQTIVPNQNVGVGPVGIKPTDFKQELTISATNKEDSIFYAVRKFQNASKALWEVKNFDSNGVPQSNPSTDLKETTIKNVVSGYQLIPYVTPPDRSAFALPLVNLEYSIDENIQTFSWSNPIYQTTDSFSGQTVANTIMAPTVVSVRNSLLSAMKGVGLSIDSDIDVQSLTNPQNGDLLAYPQLRLLGEQKSA